MVHVEATGLARAARADLEVLAVEDQRRGFLAYDLLTGQRDARPSALHLAAAQRRRPGRADVDPPQRHPARRASA